MSGMFAFFSCLHRVDIIDEGYQIWELKSLNSDIWIYHKTTIHANQAEWQTYCNQVQTMLPDFTEHLLNLPHSYTVVYDLRYFSLSSQ